MDSFLKDVNFHEQFEINHMKYFRSNESIVPAMLQKNWYMLSAVHILLGRLESTQEARVVLGCASSNSYTSLLLCKLHLVILTAKSVDQFLIEDVLSLNLFNFLPFQGCFHLLLELVAVLPGALSDHISAIVPGIQFSLG